MFQSEVSAVPVGCMSREEKLSVVDESYNSCTCSSVVSMLFTTVLLQIISHRQPFQCFVLILLDLVIMCKLGL